MLQSSGCRAKVQEAMSHDYVFVVSGVHVTLPIYRFHLPVEFSSEKPGIINKIGKNKFCLKVSAILSHFLAKRLYICWIVEESMGQVHVWCFC